jgi:hypothetical protein
MPIRPVRAAWPGSPEEIVLKLGRRRLLEAADLHALRADTAHHMLDRAVLAGGVESLADDQQAEGTLGGELVLVPGERLDASSSRASASRRFSPAVAAGSWSRLSRTGVPGAARIGSTRSFMKPRRLSCSPTMPGRASAYHRPPTQGTSGPAARERSGAGMISVLEDAGSPGERQA